MSAPGEITYPDVFVKLDGSEGNVFAIIANVANAIRRQHGRDAAQSFLDAAFASKSYTDVLALCICTVDTA